MKVSLLVVLGILACASGDAPPIPYSGGPGAQVAPFPNERVQTVSDHYVDHFGTDGFNIQSGYEGYLIPAAEHGLSPLVGGLDLKGHHGFVSKFFKNLIALGGRIIPKVTLGAAMVFGLFLIGGCVNALICTFTPFCTISFLGFGVNKDTMRSYLTPDRISSTATFVLDAIKKYKDMYETLTNEIETEKKS